MLDECNTYDALNPTMKESLCEDLPPTTTKLASVDGMPMPSQ